LATLVVQTFPQLPQFATVFSETQRPLQQPWPGVQVTHGLPAVPQLEDVLSRQTPLSQQPFGQLAGVQTSTQPPLTHAWPFPHWTPHAPQFVTVSSEVQTPLQQP